MAETTNTTPVTQNQEKRTPVKLMTDFSLGIFGSSDNFTMATQMAKAFAASTIVPKDYQNNWANGLVAIDMANRLKTSPLTVMQNLDVIQGRPAWRATFLIAMINSSGKYDFELQFDEETDKSGAPYACTCWTEKNGRKVTGIKVTMDMAKAEGWTSKNGSKWRTMPQVMLRYRAASFFSRMNCPELSNGLYTTEEAVEIADADYKVYDLEKAVEEDIKSNANKEEFIPDEPVAIEEHHKQPTVAEVVKTTEKEPVPAAGQESSIPDFMKQEEM